MVKSDETMNYTRHVSEVILHYNVEADHRRQVQPQKVVKEMNMSTMQGQEIVVKSSKCQDCGNQAKKDCAYSRCRTCCKNKGFQCQTHVRSTWIPVDRRRQRVLDQQPSPTASNLNLLQGDDIPKRHKHNPYSSEELEFPAAMSSVAIFSCVRVRSMDDTVNQIAYQTSVNIGGHVFSGLLYDQGPDQQSFNNNASRPRGDSSTHTLVHQQHNLNLMMSDGATMPSLPATTAAADHERFFPLPSFRPGMPYFSQFPKP